jgi:prevent-host-death family protein
MSVQTYTSDQARAHWRDLLDLANSGDVDVVIERHGKPTATLIGFEAYQTIQALLEEVRALQRADRAMEEWLADPSIGRSYAALRKEWVDEGILDS